MNTSTTRWQDKCFANLADVLNKIDEPVVDDESGNTRWTNWNISRCFSENQQIVCAGNSILFNMVRFQFDQSYYSNDVFKEQGTTKYGFLIIYVYKNTIYYIVNQNSNARKIIRKLLKSDTKSAVVEDMTNLDTDFFNWLIYRIYEDKAKIDPESDSFSQMSLDEICGIRGDTEDSLTKITADGESIMNTISALSFFLESSHIDLVKINLRYGHHSNIKLILKGRVVDTDFKYYNGEFDQYGPDIKTARLYVLLYLEILPVLRQEYYSDCELKYWNNQVYTKFLQELGDILSNKIKEKIKEYSIST